MLPAGLLTAAAAAFVALFILKKNPVYPSAVVAETIRNRDGKEVPLNKMTVIVTGSTNGLGKMIASELFNLGATVVIASRNQEKVAQTIQEIQSRYPGSIGKLEPGILDTSDLNSVVSFVKSFLKDHSELYAIVNNAGIHYISTAGNPIKNLDLPMRSKQGYDLAFATNYLGHFLLTELLLPILSKTSFGRIVNLSSSYHFQGDRSMLMPPFHGEKDNLSLMPAAARSDINDSNHRALAYGNNKLAQVLHAKHLQIILSEQNSKLRIISVCPGWVETGILPNDMAGYVVGKLAFQVEEGMLSAMFALFDSKLKGGEFLGNSENFWSRKASLIKFVDRMGFKKHFCDILAMWILIFQKSSYGIRHVEPSSPESLDTELAKALYDWSKEEVKTYL